MRPLLLGTTLASALALALGLARLSPRAHERAPVPALALEGALAASLPESEACYGGTLLGRARDSALVAVGAAVSVDAGPGASHVDVDSVLGGKSGVAASRTNPAVRLRLPHRGAPGSRLLVLLEVKNRAWVVSETIALDPVKHAGLETLVAASLARDPRTARGRAIWGAALVQGVLAGGEGARAAAADELEADAGVVAGALDATSVQSLATVAATLDGADAGLASLLELLAATGDVSRARDIVDVVGRSHSEVVLDRLPRLLKALGPDASASLLTGHTGLDRPALERRRAAHVLARLGAASSHAELSRLAAADDGDASSEALLGLHALGDAQAVEKARGIVRAHLLPAKRPVLEGELDQILARRSTDVLRQTPLPEGDAYRLMVAGFVLLRTAGSPDAGWLQARLSRLDDARVARFLERRAAEPWSGFDARW